MHALVALKNAPQPPFRSLFQFDPSGLSFKVARSILDTEIASKQFFSAYNASISFTGVLERMGRAELGHLFIQSTPVFHSIQYSYHLYHEYYSKSLQGRLRRATLALRV